MKKNIIYFLLVLFFSIILSFLLLKNKTDHSIISENDIITDEVDNLNLLVWNNYISKEIISEFQKKYGIEVNIFNYEDLDINDYNLDLIEDKKIDLMIVETEDIKRLIDNGFLLKLDHNLISNIENVKDDENDKIYNYDIGMNYCVPYSRGYTGIAINEKYIKDYDGSRKILWDNRYKDKISMPNTLYSVFLNSIFYLGYDPLDIDIKEIEGAAQEVINQKNIVSTLYQNKEDQIESMINEDVYIAYLHSTRFPLIKKNNHHVNFFAPKEGVHFWSNDFCIPIKARNKNNAYLFLDFLLDPDISALESSHLNFLLFNKKLKDYVTDDFFEISRNLDYPKNDEIMKKSLHTTNYSDNNLIKEILEDLAVKLKL